MAEITATFGGGCFWGVEAAFGRSEGVLSTAAGYMGGDDERRSYEAICTGETGHAEVVQVVFDDEVGSYEKLLNVFWGCHNPTQVNRQGPDRGTQYRTVIFYHSDDQKAVAEAAIVGLDAGGKYSEPVATQLVKAEQFHKAEDYHQQYLAKRGQSQCHFEP